MGTFFSGLENSDSAAKAYIWLVSAHTTSLPQQIGSFCLSPHSQPAHIAQILR